MPTPAPFVYQAYTAATIGAQVRAAPCSREVRGVVLHHTAVPSAARWKQLGSHDTLRSIYRGHVESNGWRAIGYHYIVMPDGTICPGRALGDTGAHASSWNSYTVGVSMVGNFDKDGGEHPTAAQIAATVAVLRALAERFGLNLADDYRPGGRGLAFHREEPKAIRDGKDCPGNTLSKAAVRGWLTGTKPDPEAEAEPDDDPDVDPWAAEAVARVQAAGIMQGRGGGRFAGREPCTRQELAVVVDRLMRREG